MNYKPKYCCQCGGKIGRANWTIFSSRRFCELCETDFVAQEWMPRIAFLLISVIGIVGFSGFFQSPEKSPNIASLRSSEQTNEAKKNAAINQPANVGNAANFAGKTPPQIAANTAEALPHQNINSPVKRETYVKSAERQSTDDVPTYFCGAATKKGTPCSRRVKGGGRCWQHAGQPAVLPPEKLIASR